MEYPARFTSSVKPVSPSSCHPGHSIEAFCPWPGRLASSDATRQIEAQLPWLRVWRSERNQGFLDTCNGAAALARGEVLLLLNNDTLVGDHCLDQLWDTLQRHPEAGVVGAASWGPDGLPLEVGGIIWASGEAWKRCHTLGVCGKTA